VVASDAAIVDGVPVVIRRSARRRRTVSAYRDGGAFVVLVPAGLSAREEQRWVREMVTRLQTAGQRRRPSDAALIRRAQRLSAQYLGGLAQPRSVSWSDRQQTRWGSATPASASIRLSTRLRGMPPWVIDYVLVHELAHLVVPGHDRQFWALVSGYPRTERARGYLQGVAEAAGLSLVDESDETDVADTPAGSDVADTPAGSDAPRTSAQPRLGGVSTESSAAAVARAG
jgi:predicted metal-dependent hydrolase